MEQLEDDPPLPLFDSPSILDELARIKAHLGLDGSEPAFILVDSDANEADDDEIDPFDPTGLGTHLVAALGGHD